MNNQTMKLIDLFNNETIPGTILRPWVYRGYTTSQLDDIAIDRSAGCLDNEIYLIRNYPDDTRRWVVKVADKIVAVLTPDQLIDLDFVGI